MNKNLKQIALIMLVGLLGVMIFTLEYPKKDKIKDLSYSDFLRYVDETRIEKITVHEDKKIEGTFTEDNKKFKFRTIIPYEDPTLITRLLEKKITIVGKSPDDGFFLRMLWNILPYVLFIGLLWFFMMRQVQSSGNKAMSFGKSRARLNPDMKNKVTFDDVAGIDEAKEELSEIVDFLKKPDKFVKIGAKIPKGVLLMGPPGTGKTLLARAIAGEADVRFFSISGSDFVEMFVGVGASRVRDLFEQGKKNAPCIVFIDEIDAVGRLRGAGLGGGHDEREQTLNQLLVEMDGFEANEGVIIIAATNRPDVLDPALLRPGRFDRQVVVDSPDIKGREKILAVHTRKIPLARDVNLRTIARGTPGFTGADLSNLVNEAAILAARKNRSRVTMHDMEEARDKVMMGPERRSMSMLEKEKENTAYHEAGHAIIGLILPDMEPLHKVTIIPRGRALGLTQFLPAEEKHSYARSYMINSITMTFGGYIAEKLKFNDVTSGSSNDIQRANELARRMVCEWGMSDRLGLLASGKRNEQVFVGRDWVHEKNYSEHTAQIIDEEIKAILDGCENKAREIITTHNDKFEAIARYLIERETLGAEDIELIMKGETLPPLKIDEPESAEGADATEPETEEQSAE